MKIKRNEGPSLRYVLSTPPGCYYWKPVFVWFPRKTISQKWVWLKTVYKRNARFCYNFGEFQDIVQYGNSFDILNNKWIEFEQDREQNNKIFYE